MNLKISFYLYYLTEAFKLTIAIDTPLDLPHLYFELNSKKNAH